MHNCTYICGEKKKEEMKDNKLEVGDKLYCIQYGAIRNIVTVDRLTPKTAVCGFSKFVLELDEGRAKLIGGSSYGPLWYYLETEELKLTHKKNMLIKRLSSANYSRLTLEELESVANILKVNV